MNPAVAKVSEFKPDGSLLRVNLHDEGFEIQIDFLLSSYFTNKFSLS